MADSFSQQVYDTLSQKGDDELLAIWNEHDMETWSVAAFAAIERIATKRGLHLKKGAVQSGATGGNVAARGAEQSTRDEVQSFSALVATGRIFSVSGWLFLVFGLVGCIVLFVMAVSSRSPQSIFLVVGVAALIFVQSMFLIAVKDLVALLISMERQLRRIGDRRDAG